MTDAPDPTADSATPDADVPTPEEARALDPPREDLGDPRQRHLVKFRFQKGGPAGPGRPKNEARMTSASAAVRRVLMDQDPAYHYSISRLEARLLYLLTDTDYARLGKNLSWMLPWIEAHPSARFAYAELPDGTRAIVGPGSVSAAEGDGSTDGPATRILIRLMNERDARRKELARGAGLDDEAAIEVEAVEPGAGGNGDAGTGGNGHGG